MKGTMVTTPLEQAVNPILDSTNAIRVWWLHRTVRDFPSDPSRQLTVQSRAGCDYDPHATLSRIYLAMARNFRPEVEALSNRQGFGQLSAQGRLYARAARGGGVSASLLGEWEEVEARLKRMTERHWEGGFEGGEPPERLRVQQQQQQHCYKIGRKEGGLYRVHARGG